MKKERIILLIWIFIVVTLIFTGCGNENSNGSKTNSTTNNTVNTQKNNIGNLSINNYKNDNLAVNNSLNTNLNQNKSEKKNLITSNKYRFKNTIDEVTMYFEEIYITSEWKGIKPHNDYFLIMKATAKSNTPSNNPYYFPYIVSDSSQKQYISINNTFKYDYEDSDGNTVDIATEMNLEYVKKENGKISAYNTDFVNGGKGTRYLIFDIPKETAEDSEIYFIFHGTTNDRYKDEVSSKNVYFSDYIEKRQ